MMLRTIRSPRGFLLVPLHYCLDPEKTPDWAAKRRSEYATEADWNREMEIDFTTAAGKPCYPNFRPEANVLRAEIVPMLPICLCLDFNVSPMVWVYGQIHGGKPRLCGEIKMAPATIDQCVTEFRRRFPSHPSGIRVYGDAAGNARTSQTAQSDYDLVKIAFRGYPTAVEMRVPASNPGVRDRVNAVNLALKGQDGEARLTIDPSCLETIADFGEVIWGNGERDIKKIYSERDPYSQRTHASDALGYWISWEWPTIAAVTQQDDRPRRPLKYRHVMGAV